MRGEAKRRILIPMTTTFAELGLNEQILAGVDSLGFTVPTTVQEQAIPLVLAGRDIVASAQTGTGKTAAFALPVLQRIAGITPETPAPEQPADEAAAAEGDAPSEEPKPKRRRRRRRRRGASSSDIAAIAAQGSSYGPYALVVTPTRELAQQIEQVAEAICAKTGQHAVVVTGGARFDKQLAGLAQGCDMLVATPGRLIDLMERGAVDLAQVRVLVLDEADRMLDMGFWPSVRRIVRALPEQRQTLLFSATIPPSIASTVDAMLHDPARVEIAVLGETAETVEEYLCPVMQGQKVPLLKELIAAGGAVPGEKLERVLVFCRTKQRVDDAYRALKASGFSVEVMHADRTQAARAKALEKFRAGKVQLLVATDVMSRGIDVTGIDAVVNFDVPLDPEDYVHRIGRTGRAGAVGRAYTFMAPDELTPLREVEYLTGKLIPIWDLPGFSFDANRIVPNPSRSTVKPKRTLFAGSRMRGRGPSRGFGRR